MRGPLSSHTFDGCRFAVLSSRHILTRLGNATAQRQVRRTRGRTNEDTDAVVDYRGEGGEEEPKKARSCYVGRENEPPIIVAVRMVNVIRSSSLWVLSAVALYVDSDVGGNRNRWEGTGWQWLQMPSLNRNLEVFVEWKCNVACRHSSDAERCGTV
jgi:hypothetical protein